MFRELSTSGLRLWGEWPLPRTGLSEGTPVWWAITPTPVILTACLGDPPEGATLRPWPCELHQAPRHLPASRSSRGCLAGLPQWTVPEA